MSTRLGRLGYSAELPAATAAGLLLADSQRTLRVARSSHEDGGKW